MGYYRYPRHVSHRHESATLSGGLSKSEIINIISTVVEGGLQSDVEVRQHVENYPNFGLLLTYKTRASTDLNYPQRANVGLGNTEVELTLFCWFGNSGTDNYVLSKNLYRGLLARYLPILGNNSMCKLEPTENNKGLLRERLNFNVGSNNDSCIIPERDVKFNDYINVIFLGHHLAHLSIMGEPHTILMVNESIGPDSYANIANELSMTDKIHISYNVFRHYYADNRERLKKAIVASLKRDKIYRKHSKLRRQLVNGKLDEKLWELFKLEQQILK